MKFQFKIQPFQTEAAESIVRVFAGQPNVAASKYRRDIGSEKRLSDAESAERRELAGGLALQVMLGLCVPLSAKIKQDGDVYYVNDTYLIACFKRVDTALLTEIAQKKPYYAVFRDASFASDSAMVNFEQVFGTYSPNTIRRVL